MLLGAFWVDIFGWTTAGRYLPAMLDTLREAPVEKGEFELNRGETIRLVLFSVVLLAVIAAVSFVLVRIASASESYCLSEANTLQVNGASMEPALTKGDILLYGSPQGPPAVGQVVIYRDGLSGDLTAHRVIELGQDGLGWWARTKGDANAEPDYLYLRQSNLKAVGLGYMRLWK